MRIIPASTCFTQAATVSNVVFLVTIAMVVVCTTLWVRILSEVVLSKSFLFFCNRGDTIQYHGSLQSRKLCQAPMLLVFLTPRQALSSHPLQCYCASLKLLFFMIFVGVHEFSSRLTTLSSCRRWGLNRWPLDFWFIGQFYLQAKVCSQ